MLKSFNDKRGNTLPKKYWVKDKSKFLFIRLQQEKVNSLNELHQKMFGSFGAVAIAKVKSWFGKFIDWLKHKFRWLSGKESWI